MKKLFLAFALATSWTVTAGTVFNYPQETIVQTTDMMNVSTFDPLLNGVGGYAFRTLAVGDLANQLGALYGLPVNKMSSPSAPKKADSKKPTLTAKATIAPMNAGSSLRIEKIENGFLAHHSGEGKNGEYMHKTVYHEKPPQITVEVPKKKK